MTEKVDSPTQEEKKETQPEETAAEVPEKTVDGETVEEKERPPPQKQGKIIVRNLGFDLREKHLKACFGKYGEIVDSSVPLK